MYLILLVGFWLMAGIPQPAAAAHGDDEEKVDVKSIIFDHIGDAYEWHLTTWGDQHISIPLPVILYSDMSGWHLFSSSHLTHGGEHNGFHIAQSGPHDGKIVEKRADGSEVRPIDLSLTKIAAGILVNSLLLAGIILGVSRWYRRHTPSDNAPRGFVGAVEMLTVMVYEDIIKASIGKDYKRYAPYLLTAFYFIFINNLMGLLPIFPGGANVTGNIAVTLVLALCTFLAVNLFATREYWREIFWPDVPMWMKCPVPLMPVIEFFGIFTKPFALTVRLLANIMAGHSVILALVSLIFVTYSMGAVIHGPMTVISVLFCIFMNCLELLVAFIQAYVFTMLSAVFIGMSRVSHAGHDNPQESK